MEIIKQDAKGDQGDQGIAPVLMSQTHTEPSKPPLTRTEDSEEQARQDMAFVWDFSVNWSTRREMSQTITRLSLEPVTQYLPSGEVINAATASE